MTPEPLPDLLIACCRCSPPGAEAGITAGVIVAGCLIAGGALLGNIADRRAAQWPIVLASIVALAIVALGLLFGLTIISGFGLDVPGAVGFGSISTCGFATGIVARRRALQRDDSPPEGICTGCGYSLDGLPDRAPCPECGRADPRSWNQDPDPEARAQP